MISLPFKLPIFDYLFIIRKKLWMLILIMVLVLGLTAYATFKQAPLYESACEIRYRRAIPSGVLSPGSPLAYLSSYFDSVAFETEKYVIKSAAVVEGVVETLGLASRDNPTAWKSWVRRIQSMLSITRVKDTRIYRIEARYINPDLTQAIANTTAAVYIDFSLKEKKESAQKILALLTGQIKDLENRIKISQAKLTGSVNSEYFPEIDSVTVASESGVGLTSPEDRRILGDLRARLLELDILKEEYLGRYKQKHPKVKEVERRIVILDEKITEQNERIIQTHKNAIEYQFLQKEVAASQELYNALIQKLRELDISDRGIESNIEIIQQAERPTIPIAPRKKRNLILGAILGFFLGAGTIFLTEYFDPTLQTPEEAERYLGLPVLAFIPRMLAASGMNQKEKDQFFFQVSSRNPRGNETEMFKRLRTNIRLNDFESPSVALMVTSSNPREGKTTIAANLAITMAQARTRIVLIDTDLRRPRLSGIFNVGNTPGASSYLKGEAGIEEILRPTTIDNLMLIPAGKPPSNPSELLDSPRFGQLISALKERFTWIIFDSPPAGVLADASIIGDLVDGVILVCFAGHTDKKFIFRTKQQIEKGGSRIYGVVLNNIEPKLRSYNYYYQSLYKYGYQ